MSKKFRILGVMSGSSIDGLDIALCDFFQDGEQWRYELVKAETILYTREWKHMLIATKDLNSLYFAFINNDFGTYVGECINEFIKNHEIDRSSIQLIASHGHTVFHQPDKKLTCQIGNGAAIAAVTKIPCACDFRSLDVMLGGQGAPLVPIGDELLFSEYDYCLNIGGISNISYKENNQRIAFDVCPSNIVLNELANRKGLEFDKNGEIGRTGDVVSPLLNDLNDLPYYKQKNPKSLGKEWVEDIFMPVLAKYSTSVENTIRTVYEHIAIQIALIVKKDASVLITGGGAFNGFLIDLIKTKSKSNIIIPEKDIIDFKEAIIFGFLGLLRYLEKPNCLSAVTGASMDNIGGVIYKV
jgi:anhydro-N-acetylmuramic acid kinase